MGALLASFSIIIPYRHRLDLCPPQIVSDDNTSGTLEEQAVATAAAKTSSIIIPLFALLAVRHAADLAPPPPPSHQSHPREPYASRSSCYGEGGGGQRRGEVKQHWRHVGDGDIC